MDEASEFDITENIAAFEAAVSAEHLDIPVPELERVLVAIDQSNQDRTTEDMALAVARRHNTSLDVVYAYEGDTEAGAEAYLRQRVARLRETGIDVNAFPRLPGKRSYDQILAAQKSRDCNLILVDAPYLDDFEDLGTVSIGANLDMLLHRFKVPLLIVREPEDQPNEEFRTILLPAVFSPQQNVNAAAWAFRLIHEAGTLRIFLIADVGSMTEAYVDLNDEAMLALKEKEQAGFIAAIQKRAAQMGIRCQVKARTGEPVTALREVINEGDCLTTVGHPGICDIGAHQRLLALIRESINPVLVV